MKEITSLELRFLVKKLKKIQGRKIQKIKQVNGAYSFEVYGKGEKDYLIVIPDKGLFLTKENYKGEPKSDFCHVLRKKLTGQTIENISQHGFDRVIDILTQDSRVVLELFGKGNIILVKRSDNKIVRAINMRSWSSRTIKPGYKYKYPPSPINPFELTKEEIENKLKDNPIKTLAKDFGFGGEFAENISGKLKEDIKDPEKVHDFFQNIEKEFPDLEKVNGEFQKSFKKYLKKPEEDKLGEKLKSIRKSQERKLKEFTEKEEIYRNYADSIYGKYAKFDNKLTRLRELQKLDVDEEEIESRLDVQFIPESTKVIISDVTIDFKKTLEEDANRYYNLAKKMKSKIEGVKKSIKEITKDVIKKNKKTHKIKTKKKPKHWYDKFRWFKSSDGFLVVSGKDAETNERLIRKYMKKNDLVFHTDITGSPFTNVRNIENEKVPESTIREAAEFCGAYSKAWKIGISLVDVYYIKPDQVKKEGGLPTGSFMIYGKREWIKQIPVKIAVGEKDGNFIYGPPSLVEKVCDSFIEIEPGESSPKELFEKIKEKINVDFKDFQRIIPYGKGRIEDD